MDRTKETITALRFWLTVWIAIFSALASWAANNYEQHTGLAIVSVLGLMPSFIVILVLNWLMFAKIKELK